MGRFHVSFPVAGDSRGSWSVELVAVADRECSVARASFADADSDHVLVVDFVTSRLGGRRVVLRPADLVAYEAWRSLIQASVEASKGGSNGA